MLKYNKCFVLTKKVSIEEEAWDWPTTINLLNMLLHKSYREKQLFKDARYYFQCFMMKASEDNVLDKARQGN